MINTILKLSSIVFASVVITGCVQMQVPDNYCGMTCQLELREQRELLFVNSGRMYNTHKSQEWRKVMANSRRTAEHGAEKGLRRITTAGPDLSVYGIVGASGYLEVLECKRDVNLEVQAREQREEFLRVCYDLLPVKHRQAFYESDQRVPIYDPPVIIGVPVLDRDPR